MKITRFALLAILLLILTGCEAMARAEREADAERRQRCMDYGYAPQTFGFGQCLEYQEYKESYELDPRNNGKRLPPPQPQLCEGGPGARYEDGKGGVFLTCY